VKTVCCIASGPSLTREDCAIVERGCVTTIAVNSSWEMARFAAYIYAGDKGWWVQNGAKIDIPAKRICCDATATIHHGTKTHMAAGSYNSGQMAIRYAYRKLGAQRIILLGYDCSVAKGVHWHGPHARLKNPEASTCLKWVRQFELVAAEAAALKVQILNCSRDTALTCFERRDLLDVIEAVDRRKCRVPREWSEPYDRRCWSGQSVALTGDEPLRRCL